MSRGLKFICIAAVMFIFWIVTAPYLAKRLIIEQKLAKADVIFVLSGSAVYKERTGKAAVVYRAGVSERILLSDDGVSAGWSKTDERNPKFVELAKRALTAQGVDEKSISILDADVTGTIYEARGFSKAARATGWKSVMIVTSAYHTRRALNTFENELKGSGIRVGIVSPAPGEQTPSVFSWWLTPRGWRYVAGEYVKSWYYWVFY